MIAACDDYRYGLLGCTDYHDNCTDNLIAGMRQIGLTPPEVPSPLNLWMNIPVGRTARPAGASPCPSPATMWCCGPRWIASIAMSACPQDILPINKGKPVEVHYQVLS